MNKTYRRILNVSYWKCFLRTLASVFKRPKNREDSSKFDDFWTKRIVSARPISGKIFERTKRTKSFRKIRKSFKNFFEKFFDKFLNFSKTFCSFRSFETFSENRSRQDDLFGPKIVEIGAILAIFRPFEFFSEKFSLPWAANHMNKNMKQLNPRLQVLF